MKRIISLLLVLVMLLGLGTGALAAYEHTQFFNENHGKYEMKADGTTIFTGDGEISTSALGTGWSSTANDITTLIIGEGFTALTTGTGLSGPFRSADELTSVTLPSTMRILGDSSFAFCYELQSVVMPHGVTFIGEKCFYACRNLTEFSIPASVKEIGSNAFGSCRNLTTIHYAGTEEMWNDITFGADTDWMDDVTITFNDAATCQHEIKALENAVIPTLQTAGYSGDEVCQNCRKLLKAGSTLDPVKLPFTDLKENWYMEPVAWAYTTGVTTGMSETTFVPNGNCTRAQVVTFLHRAAGSPEPTSTTNPFKDVPAGQWYTKAILWAVEQGITNGTSATTFSPNNNVTRAQFVTFLWRADGAWKQDDFENPPFADVMDSDQYYYDAVIWAARNGYANGTGNGKFSPTGVCTRAQTVTFLHRYYADSALTAPTGVALNRYQIIVGDVYRLNHTLTGVVVPDAATDTPITWSSSNTAIATVDTNGKVTLKDGIKIGSTAQVTATAGNAKTSCNISTYMSPTHVNVANYVSADYRYMMRNYSIKNITDIRGGTYVNVYGERCVITMFWVRGYNALGGLVTECFQTLHNMDTGETIYKPVDHYEKLADRYYGGTKLYYMELESDYLWVQTHYNLFPIYTISSSGAAVRK